MGKSAALRLPPLRMKCAGEGRGGGKSLSKCHSGRTPLLRPVRGGRTPLSSPANQVRFSAPANIPLTANAVDAVGTIAKVEFYHGNTVITTLTAPPYSMI
jgi:Big-like domain-containing protein